MDTKQLLGCSFFNEAMGKGRKTLVLVIAKLRKKYTLKALLNYTKLAKSTYMEDMDIEE